MCKYTYAHLECGHRISDTADTRECPYYTSRGSILCDPDNPANRQRVSITSETRSGICERCRRVAPERKELDAMQKDLEKVKALSEKERREREDAMKKHEEGLFRQSREEYERNAREREKKDLEAVMKASREADERRARQEEEDLARALKESCKWDDVVRDVDVKEEVFDRGQYEVEGGTVIVVEVEKTTITRTEKKADAIPPPPPLPPVKLAFAPRAAPVEKQKQKPKVTDYTRAPIGYQAYGQYLIGTRRQPIHESQKPQDIPISPKSPTKPSIPAPSVRLGSTMNPSDVPIIREARPTIPSTSSDVRSNLRKTTGPRSPLSPTGEVAGDTELSRKLAKRRTWEPQEDDAASQMSLTPSESASNVSGRAGVHSVAEGLGDVSAVRDGDGDGDVYVDGVGR